MESRYERLRRVGIGSYGIVFKCVNRQTGQIVAIKRYSENDSDPIIRKIAMREVRMLRQLKHPNLINLIEAFRRKRRLHLVFDYCELTLLDVIEKYNDQCPMPLIKKIIWQTVNGISYCHAQNCVHRDIKPENILICQSGVVKLCDFGFARSLSKPARTSASNSATCGSANGRNSKPASNGASKPSLSPSPALKNADTIETRRSSSQSTGKEQLLAQDKQQQPPRQALTEYVATRWYRAPELLIGDAYYDTKIDIWAIGCVTCELMRGEPMWPGKTDLDQLTMIKNSLGPLTERQSVTLVTQAIYGQASIGKLLGAHPAGDPIERKLPPRVGKSGIDFVASCLRMDETLRLASDVLLMHPFIHQARIAHFVTNNTADSQPLQAAAKRQPRASVPVTLHRGDNDTSKTQLAKPQAHGDGKQRVAGATLNKGVSLKATTTTTTSTMSTMSTMSTTRASPTTTVTMTHKPAATTTSRKQPLVDTDSYTKRREPVTRSLTPPGADEAAADQIDGVGRLPSAVARAENATSAARLGRFLQQQSQQQTRRSQQQLQQQQQRPLKQKWHVDKFSRFAGSLRNLKNEAAANKQPNSQRPLMSLGAAAASFLPLLTAATSSSGSLTSTPANNNNNGTNTGQQRQQPPLASASATVLNASRKLVPVVEADKSGNGEQVVARNAQARVPNAGRVSPSPSPSPINQTSASSTSAAAIENVEPRRRRHRRDEDSSGNRKAPI